MNFKDYLTESTRKRITVTRIDEEITVTPLDGAAGNSSALSSDSESGDIEFELGDNNDTSDSVKNSDRTNPIQKAMDVLSELDDYLQGNGGTDPEFGDISDSVQELRGRLKGKLSTCSPQAPIPSSAVSSNGSTEDTTLEIPA